MSFGAVLDFPRSRNRTVPALECSPATTWGSSHFVPRRVPVGGAGRYNDSFNVTLALDLRPMDYKTTLNLPATDFPMKANLAQREPERLRRWAGMDLYSKLRAMAGGRPKFILHDGPPYANGVIHIGHALNKVLKDIIVKAKTLGGYDAPYVPGWDCHGLPIELMVEKSIGKAGYQVSAQEFRAACRAYAATQIDRQKTDFMRLGVVGDWEHPYRSMDFQFEADIIRALGKIIANGHLAKGYKPVHWCTDCRSALAEAEVEYQEKPSPAIDVRFRVIDEQALIERCHHVAGRDGHGFLSVVIWTTTPWTLPANQAVALNPKFDYVVVQTADERLLLAEQLVKDALGRYEVDDYRVIAYAKGQALEGLLLHHPFYKREVPIIVGEHVTADAGTGCVHTAPGHGQDDYVVGQRYGLAVENPVGDDGKFLPGTGFFAGEHVKKANAHVIEILQEHHALLREMSINHSYPHCWRHKTPVIFRATPQWFIAMDENGLRDAALAEIRNVQWIPDWGQARIEGMVLGRPDWCVSRQRNWGVPIPLFVHKETSMLHPDTSALLEQVAQRVEQCGIDGWFDLPPEDLIGDDVVYYDKIHDTLDVWFDSGVTHAGVLSRRAELQFPADLYLEGSDQHRGWFQSSLLASVAMHGVAPYKQVLTHGFTVDEQGRKMSKSLGNVVAPQDVINKLGADVLRLWVAATDYRGEMSVSPQILDRTADVYRRLRNTARYFLANLSGFEPARDSVPFAQMLALDRWAVDRASHLQAEVLEAYESYQFHQVFHKVHQFCAVDMGGFYLDVLKDRMYTMRTDSLGRCSAQTAMSHIAEAFVRWIAPILSFTAEEIWEYLPGARAESVFLATWYEHLQALPLQDRFNCEYWERVLAVREAVRKELELLRAAGVIGAGLEAEVDLYCPPELIPVLAELDDELRFVLLTSYARVLPLAAAPSEAKPCEIDGLRIRAYPTTHGKCVRCWHRRADVGTYLEHPELCGRCVDNVMGNGELRRYA